MRSLIVAFVLLSMPAVAADYSPWPGQDVRPTLSASVELAQNGPSCCRHCRWNEQPCGSKCISAKAMCTAKPGCACPGAP